MASRDVFRGYVQDPLPGMAAPPRRQADDGAEAMWILAEELSREHVVQLYSSEIVLIEALRMFTLHGLERGDVVVLALTPSHRDLLQQSLYAAGVDVATVQDQGRLRMVAAAELLEHFMLDGMPDRALFTLTLGSLIEEARASGRRIRVFGEMVDLLWKSNLPAAIRLEELWTELIASQDISLFCAYSTREIPDRFPEALWSPHSHVIASAATDCLGDAIVGQTLDSRIVSWNAGAQHMFGYTREEAIGHSTALLIPRECPDEVPALIERIVRGEQVGHLETRRRRKDGTEIDVSIDVSPIRTRDRTLVGAVALIRDISARKVVENWLHGQAAIIDSSDDAIIGKTLDAIVVSWNRGAERIYGYTADEMVGQPMATLLPAGAEDDISHIMERIRRGEKIEHYEARRRRKDGFVIDVSITVSPIISDQGEVVGASAVARDITARREAERIRLEVARIEHIQATNRLLLERTFQIQEQERRRIARELHDEAGQLMASLLVGLRALEDATTLGKAKAQARQLRDITVKAIDEVGRLARGLHPTVLDDHGLSVAIRRYTADFGAVHGVTVETTLDEGDLRDVSQEAQLAMFRILQEALTNVAKHSRADRVRICFTRSSAGLHVTIADNGRGFDFSEESASVRHRLGLHGMRERAAILDGTLTILSDTTGTTIQADIPLASNDDTP